MVTVVTTALRNYTRWYQSPGEAGVLVADILGTSFRLEAVPGAGVVRLQGRDLTPDEARLIGVRLIDAAVLADGDRAVRAAPQK